MTEPDSEVRHLVDQRQAARERRDFATADALRDQLRRAGWLVRDTPDGPELAAAPPYQTVDPAALAPRWDEPDRHDVSVVVHVAGWPEDVARATRALAAHHPDLAYEVLLVSDGAGETTGRALEDLAAADHHVRVLHLDPAIGFGACMNLGMGQALGRVLVWLDPHVEATGDLLGPLLAALDQPGTGLAGGWGVTTTSMLEFEADDGPEVDAVEGYLLAVPRRWRPGSRSTPRTATTATPTSITPSPSAPSGTRPIGAPLRKSCPISLGTPPGFPGPLRPNPSGRPGSRCRRPGTGTEVSPTPIRGNGTARPERTTIVSSGAGRAAPIS